MFTVLNEDNTLYCKKNCILLNIRRNICALICFVQTRILLKRISRNSLQKKISKQKWKSKIFHHDHPPNLGREKLTKDFFCVFPFIVFLCVWTSVILEFFFLHQLPLFLSRKVSNTSCCFHSLFFFPELPLFLSRKVSYTSCCCHSLFFFVFRQAFY